ncbi:MAG: S9 family peptidase, partial [Chloroflexota bacterium]|nr:S9 family peptidase [Chloroflexota bacterium]
MLRTAPFGGWRSPITPAFVAAGEIPLGHVQVSGQEIYWLEGKPLEGGRIVLVRGSGEGPRTVLTPPPFNVRTRVHEYGGGAYVAHQR